MRCQATPGCLIAHTLSVTAEGITSEETQRQAPGAGGGRALTTADQLENQLRGTPRA